MPQISVITTCFNENIETFKRSFLSIINQSFKDFEYLIFPGNPKNIAVIDFLKDYQKIDERVKVIDSLKVQKSTFCLNHLIKISKADFIAIQEADDYAYPERLEKQLYFMQSIPEAGACSMAVRYVQEETGEQLFVRRFPFLVGREINKFQAINTACAMFRKESFEKAGYFDETLNNENVQDYDLWLKLYTNGIKLYNMPEVLFDYYTSNNNVRNRKPKSVLIYTIKVKLKYRDKLNFSISDWLYVGIEYCVYMLPSIFIKKLFNIWYRIKK